METRHILRIRWDVPHSNPAWRVDRGRAFQQYRWRLFAQYTLPSLQRQSVPWHAWLWADPELRGLHEELPLDDSRVHFVYDLAGKARSTGEAASEQAFMIGRIDSDDMLAPEALQILGQRARDTDATKPILQLFSGCAYEERRNRLSPWRHPSPAFVFQLVTGRNLADGFPSFGGKHSKAHKKSLHVETPAPAFCVILHAENLSNSPQAKYAKGRLSWPVDLETRAKFGLPKASGSLMALVQEWWSRFG